jgi:hypothetical protein
MGIFEFVFEFKFESECDCEFETEWEVRFMARLGAEAEARGGMEIPIGAEKGDVLGWALWMGESWKGVFSVVQLGMELELLLGSE